MQYHATHEPVWRNGIRACLKNKSPQGVEGSNPSTGIACLRMSMVVDSTLCDGYLAHPFTKWMGLHLISSFFSELWHPRIKAQTCHRYRE